MQRLVLVAFTFLSLIELNPFGPSLAEKYINRFHKIAISEMNRSNIPASIKLAQGLLESDWGRSDLATVGNNHFGIKCGGDWNGNRFYKEDDDRNRKGELIESCFRVYDHPEASYIAHSDFLSEPRKSGRYDFLFDLPSDDYKGWARGLQKAGYATDPSYPKKLIKIIEKYNLHEFDLEYYSDEEVIADIENKNEIEELDKKGSGSSKSSKKRSIQYINETPYIIASKNETPFDISKEQRIPLYKLQKYNDGLGDSKTALVEGSIVYLDMKQADYKNSGKSDHLVLKGDNMHSIAQRYGIKLNSLYTKNRIPRGAEPLVGQSLKLDGIVKLGKRPKFKTATEIEADASEFLFDEDFVGAND